MTARPLTEVFKWRILGIAHLLNHNVDGWRSFPITEKLTVNYLEGDANTLPRIEAWRGHGGTHHQPLLRIGNITPNGVADLVYGDETVLKSEQLGSIVKTIDNRHGARDIDVDMRDLFSETDASESSTEKSAGGSVSVTVSASESIEGVASFEESVTAEVHTEIAESESSSSESGKEDESSETTTVPVGVLQKFTLNRKRTDTSQRVTGTGEFTHDIRIGLWDHKDGHNDAQKFHRSVYFESWGQFCDVVHGHSPDNYPLAAYFKQHPIRTADLWAIKDLNSEVQYDVKFEGRIESDYTSEIVEDLRS